MIFALCSASLIHCITLTYSQESVYSHLNVIFTRGQGVRNARPPRTRKAWVLRPWKKFEKNWENVSVRYVSQKYETIRTYLRQNWDLSHYCEKSSKAQSETNTRKKWDLDKTRKRKNWAIFFLSGWQTVQCLLFTMPPPQVKNRPRVYSAMAVEKTAVVLNEKRAYTRKNRPHSQGKIAFVWQIKIAIKKKFRAFCENWSIKLHRQRPRRYEICWVHIHFPSLFFFLFFAFFGRIISNIPI